MAPVCCREGRVGSDVPLVRTHPTTKEHIVKYVILIHSNPRPWGHPTGDFVADSLALPQEQRDRMGADFDALLSQMSANGELTGGEALGDPATSRIHRWDGTRHVVTDGPYAEAKEHLAGFFLIDVETRERAEELAGHFAGPGDTVELRPAYVWPDEASDEPSGQAWEAGAVGVRD
jgi:hypothetical protein